MLDLYIKNILSILFDSKLIEMPGKQAMKIYERNFIEKQLGVILMLYLDRMFQVRTATLRVTSKHTNESQF